MTAAASDSRTQARLPLVLFDAHQLGRRQTGNETYVRETLRALRDESAVRIRPAVEAAGFDDPLVGHPFERRRVPRNGFLRLAALAILANSGHVDVVHSIYFAPVLTRRPSVVTIHDISYEVHSEFFGRSELLRNRTLIRDSARRATRVVTVSETSRRDLLERYGLHDDQVVVIPNGVGHRYFNRPAPEPRPINDVPLRLLAVGNLQPRKNLIRLLAAVRRIAMIRPVYLRVVGPDGYQAARIRAMLSQSADVDVVGYMAEDDLVDEYRRADIFVYPSIYEGFGLPVLEAMACGVPVVTTTGGALPEVAGDAALLVDPLDEIAMANAILSIADDLALRTSLRLRGLARARLFSWSDAASKLVDVYRSAIG